MVFGATVELLNVESNEEVTWKIVGEDEADVKSRMISVNSPIARAMIGKSEGDTVVVKAPSGDIEYEVLSVSYI